MFREHLNQNSVSFLELFLDLRITGIGLCFWALSLGTTVYLRTQSKYHFCIFQHHQCPTVIQRALPGSLVHGSPLRKKDFKKSQILHLTMLG